MCYTAANDNLVHVHVKICKSYNTVIMYHVYTYKTFHLVL